ncbi:hypothetical protein MPER_13408, partial [Moniliophthora perniciosa FA553]
SCISNPSATFVPSGPSGTAAGGSANGGSSSSGSGNNGAVALVGDKNAIFGMVGVIVVGAFSAVWTLA